VALQLFLVRNVSLEHLAKLLDLLRAECSFWQHVENIRRSMKNEN
jgi:hypothetical protein